MEDLKKQKQIRDRRIELDNFVTEKSENIKIFNYILLCTYVLLVSNYFRFRIRYLQKSDLRRSYIISAPK